MNAAPATRTDSPSTSRTTPTAAYRPNRSASAPGRTPGHAPERTGAGTPEAAGVIEGARDRIDSLDDRIIGLIQERMAASTVIQQTRIASGGRRVNLSREMEILGQYRDALGKPGTALAMTLLELCRGKV